MSEGEGNESRLSRDTELLMSASKWESDAHFGLIALGRTIYSRRRRALAILATFTVVGVAVAFALPVRYAAYATLSPEPATNDRLALGGALATLGGQLGIDLPGTGNRAQLRFYPGLIHSYWLLSRLATSTKVGDTALSDVLLASRTASLEPLEADQLVSQLTRSIQVDLDDRANTFTITVVLPSRGLALAACNQVISLVTEFDTRVRRSRASENRRFLEVRTDSAHAALGASEDDLALFEQRNRTFAQSPDLNLQHQRLERRVNLLQDVYLTLARNLEQARIEEVKATPVLTVVDPPHVQWRKASPKRAQVVASITAIGALIVLALGFLPANLRDILRSSKE